MKNSIDQPHRMGYVKHIYLVGIAGVGMSGIALVLVNRGFIVSGSDIAPDPVILKTLQDSGVQVYEKHDATQLQDVDVLVVSSAIAPSNVECQSALASGIPILKRAEMLAELMRFHRGIAVSGSHGKTTTTSMIATILSHAGEDPTYVIGGHIKCSAGQMRVGKQDYFIAEADESDGSFLYLRPILAVVTSIDYDHLETYGGQLDALQAAFVQFANQLPFYGVLVMCLDDPNVAMLRSKIQRTCVTYGFHSDADYHIVDVTHHHGTSHIKIRSPEHTEVTVKLPCIGVHQVSNALASIAVARACHINWSCIQKALSTFPGVKRRFDILGVYDFTSTLTDITVVDDYGHHPKAIRVTLDAAKMRWPDCRIVLCFEPHRYTRLHALFNDFLDALSIASVIVLMPVYACGEKPIEGATTTALAKQLKLRGICEQVIEIKDTALFHQDLLQILQPKDVLLCQGAGCLSQMIREYLEKETQFPSGTSTVMI